MVNHACGFPVSQILASKKKKTKALGQTVIQTQA